MKARSFIFPLKKNYACPSHKLYIFVRNVKRIIIQSILLFLYSLVKEMTDKPSNVTAATNLFFSVYVIGMTCFNECFLFYVITERHYNPNTKLIKFVIVNFGKILFSSLF